MGFTLRIPFNSCFNSGSRKVFTSFAKKYVNSRIGSIYFMSTQKDFEEAKSRLNSLSSSDPGSGTKLKIYGLFKQSTEGAVSTKRPGMTDFVGRAKWDAWKAVGDISKEEAQKAYIDLVNSLAKDDHPSNEPQTPAAAGQMYPNMLVECDGGLRKITINKPNKRNALSSRMYEEVVLALNEAADDPKTVITALTGAGSYFSSGNDLGNFKNISIDKRQKSSDVGSTIVKRLVGTLIDFPKPLFAVLNGPAVGIAVTILGLCDGVYASDKATFQTPFSPLGITVEGCSSLTFPRLMGHGNACDLLIFNKKITAAEAFRLGLVTEVFPDASLQAEVWPRLQALSKLPIKSLIYSKELVRALDKGNLHKINDMESERLKERVASDDCINAVRTLLNRKK